MSTDRNVSGSFSLGSSATLPGSQSSAPGTSASVPSKAATFFGGHAEITPVPPREAGRVLNQFHNSVAVALIFLPVVVGLIGGFGMILTGMSFAGTHGIVTMIFVLSGFAIGGGSILVLLRYQHFLPSVYLRAIATSVFADRTGTLVRPTDEGVLFMEILPRSSFGKLGPASDIGFFQIDREAKELRFEGDSKRYRIPYAALKGCKVESIRLDSDKWGTDLYFVTVLTVITSSGSREIALHAKQLKFQRRRMPERQAEAEDLCDAIQEATASQSAGVR
jgi:hypothetical protein